jgi:hypothetical protein
MIEGSAVIDRRYSGGLKFRVYWCAFVVQPELGPNMSQSDWIRPLRF